MNTILIAGYKSFELGIFQDKDPRVAIIKAVIKRDLVHFLDEGVQWLIFMGNLGFEYWTLDVANHLKKDYEFKTATIFDFENHGENWNESNQEKLQLFKQTDFVKYTYPAYQNPSQFQHYNQFLLDNTDGAYVFYDQERETNLKYLYQLMKEKANYELKTLTFDDLNDFMSDHADEES